MMEWISVKDRMPDPEFTVPSGRKMAMTVVAHTGGCDVAAYYEDAGFYIGGIFDGSERSCEIRERVIKSITHWMPLPEPPK